MIMQPELVYTTYIRTTPEKVWNAITNPEFTRQYWGGNENVSDWKPVRSGSMHPYGRNGYRQSRRQRSWKACRPSAWC